MFQNRREAGKKLASALICYKGNKDALILGLARGGVAVASEIAKALTLPLNVALPRKIGAPGNAELALGAISEKGEAVFNDALIRTLHVSKEEIQQSVEKEKAIIHQKEQLFHRLTPKASLKDKIVILVDDGIATGATLFATIQEAKKEGAKKIVVAIPVASSSALERVKKLADEVFCLEVGDLGAVSFYYEEFNQVTDEEVLNFLEKAPLPLLGLGTWNLRGKECTKSVSLALELGYRHIDTAHVYENHQAIGKAIASFKREELFLTSKIALEQIDPQAIQASVHKACDLALKELGTSYLDLYLLHFPDHNMPMDLIFSAMQELIQQKKVLHIGVSNFTIHHLQDLEEKGFIPFANQVEFHPYLFQKELWHYCQNRNITLIAYRPLGKGALLNDPVISSLALKHHKTTSQIILRWLIQKNIPTIPKASTLAHLKENLAIFDFELSSQEMETIDGLNQNKRFAMEDEKEFLY